MALMYCWVLDTKIKKKMYSYLEENSYFDPATRTARRKQMLGQVTEPINVNVVLFCSSHFLFVNVLSHLIRSFLTAYKRSANPCPPGCPGSCAPACAVSCSWQFFQLFPEQKENTSKAPSTPQRRNLKTEVSLGKRIKCFPCKLRQKNLKTQQSPVTLNFYLRKLAWLTQLQRFRKACLKCSKFKADVFKFLWLKERFRKASFSKLSGVALTLRGCRAGKGLA